MALQLNLSRQSIGPCPWCGPGTALSIKGDGFGGQSLCCRTCGCRGPAIQVDGDLADADGATLRRWSERAVAAVTEGQTTQTHPPRYPASQSVRLPTDDARKLLEALRAATSILAPHASL